MAQAKEPPAARRKPPGFAASPKPAAPAEEAKQNARVRRFNPRLSPCGGFVKRGLSAGERHTGRNQAAVV